MNAEREVCGGHVWASWALFALVLAVAAAVDLLGWLGTLSLVAGVGPGVWSLRPCSAQPSTNRRSFQSLSSRSVMGAGASSEPSLVAQAARRSTSAS